jgi:hypothetical protein
MGRVVQLNDVKNGWVIDMTLCEMAGEHCMMVVADTCFGSINTVFEGIMDQGNQSQGLTHSIRSGKTIYVRQHLSDMIPYLAFPMP